MSNESSRDILKTKLDQMKAITLEQLLTQDADYQQQMGSGGKSALSVVPKCLSYFVF